MDTENTAPGASVIGVLAPHDVAAYAAAWLEVMHLNENQAVFSMLGLDGIIQPRLSNAQGRGRLIDTGDLESSALLAIYGVNYLPNRQKIRPKDLSDTQWNMALHLMNMEVGGITEGGELNNVPKSFGIDVSTQAGLGEVELALAEKESAFDKIELELSEEQYQGILAYVRTITVGSDSDRSTSVVDAWHDTAGEMLFTLYAHKIGLGRAMGLIEAMPLPSPSQDGMANPQVSAMVDVLGEVTASGRTAHNALESLRYMYDTARGVNGGAALSAMAALESSIASTDSVFRSVEERFNLASGVIIQYVINGRGSADDAAASFAAIRAELHELYSRAQTEAAEGSTLYGRIGELITPLEQPVSRVTATGPRRPDWLS